MIQSSPLDTQFPCRVAGGLDDVCFDQDLGYGLIQLPDQGHNPFDIALDCLYNKGIGMLVYHDRAQGLPIRFLRQEIFKIFSQALGVCEIYRDHFGVEQFYSFQFFLFGPDLFFDFQLS